MSHITLTEEPRHRGTRTAPATTSSEDSRDFCSLLVPQDEGRAVAFDADLGPELLGCIREP